MNWILKISSIPAYFNVSMMKEDYHRGCYVTLLLIDNVIIKSTFEDHTKLYNFFRKQGAEMRINSYGIEFLLCRFNCTLNAYILDIDFKYEEMLNSNDRDTQELAVALFMGEILERI